MPRLLTLSVTTLALAACGSDAGTEVGNHWEYGGAQAARVGLADIRAALERLRARS